MHIKHLTLTRALSAVAAAAALGQAGAQTLPPPQNVVSLSASATVEVSKDWLTVVFATTREGTDAGAVQSQLKQALDAALAEARKLAKPGQVEVQTGGFSLQPRYAPKGGINGWQGTAQLQVPGAKLCVVSNQGEAREKVEADVAAQAIARFRSRAEAVAKQFGFGGYVLREVTVASNEPHGGPQPMMRLQAARASMADEALPVEAGKASVTATVNGSVQMQ